MARNARFALLGLVITTNVDTPRGMLCVASGVGPTGSVEDGIGAEHPRQVADFEEGLKPRLVDGGLHDAAAVSQEQSPKSAQTGPSAAVLGGMSTGLAGV